MSTHVVGLAPADDQWRKMKAIYDAYHDADLPVPEDILKFFDYQEPDPSGVTVDLPITEWHDDVSEGYELRVSDIPAHVQVIRFFNSW